MARKKNALGFAGMLEQRCRVFERGRQRLFAENMKALVERRVRDRRVIAGRRADVDEVEVRGFGFEKRFVIGIDARLRKRLLAL